MDSRGRHSRWTAQSPARFGRFRTGYRPRSESTAHLEPILRRVVAVLCFVWCGPAAAAELRVGRAQVDITPPVGAVMGNSYGITVSTGVSSALHAKAIAFESGGARAAIVACDLISLHQPIVEKARALIAATTGIPPERVILAATHCHAGPQTYPALYELAGEEARKLSAAYAEKLPGLIAESVRLAEADLRPARMFAGREHEDSVSFNRRFLLRDGSVKTNPGRDPNALRPVGPIDPEVGVVYVEATDGTPLATVVNFALHVAIVTGSRFSADFPHVMAEALARVKGPGMLTMFLNGPSGNVNHVDVFHPERRLRAEAEAARVGGVLAAAVLKAYHQLKPVDTARIQAVTRPVNVPVPAAPPAGEVEAARATLRRWGQGAPFADVIRAWRAIDLAEYGRNGTWNSEAQAITFGRDLALVGYPGDSFVEFGLAIKQNSPFAFTFVSEQSGNGSISYIPTERAFPEGSYEVESARVAPGGGEVLATAATRLLTEMFPRVER